MGEDNTMNRALGRIEGKLDAQGDSIQYLTGKVEGMDNRLRSVETRAALSASTIATGVSIGVSLIVAKLRSFVGP